MGNVTGGPVVKPLHFYCRGMAGKLRSHMPLGQKQKKNYCGASNQANRTDFLMIS